jgi:hypothetical protein
VTITITVSRRAVILLLVAMTALALTFLAAGCSQKQQEQFRDAPISTRDRSASEVYDSPDGFSNWSEKCDHHGNRVFIAFHSDSAYAAIAAVPDAACPKQ